MATSIFNQTDKGLFNLNMQQKLNIVNQLISDTKIPRMIKIRQKFSEQAVDDIQNEVRRQLGCREICEKIRPGMEIAITAGSRGIANIAVIIREVCSIVKETGATPFIVPAMGSHGGATAEGQRRLIEGYGITEEFCGAEIRSSMEVKHIGNTADGRPVSIDRNAAEADGIIVIGRIKAHTDFRGRYESGLMKMMVIGLGKQKGAESFHAAGTKHYAEQLPLYGTTILNNAPVLFGLGIIENAYDQTAKLVALLPQEIIDKEPELLVEAKALMGRLLFDNCDLLIVDRIGKDISGEGMDANVTGRFATKYASGGIEAETLAVLSLTKESHGAFVGLGMADVTTRRVLNEADFDASYANTLTSTILLPSRLPLVMDSDRQAIQACLKYCGGIDHDNPRVIRIIDTMHLGEILISEAMLAEALKNPNIEVLSEPFEMPFDDNGALQDIGKI